MNTVWFDHYSNQEHDTVREFLANWGEHPWNDMNIPLGMSVADNWASITVFHPRKNHAKTVAIHIEDYAALDALRATFRDVPKLYSFASTAWENFANGVETEPDFPLYYWGETL